MRCINCGAPVPLIKWRGNWRGRERQSKLTRKIPGWSLTVFTCSNRCVLAIRGLQVELRRAMLFNPKAGTK